VGDNGAGKSTLMKTITGIYSADEGSIIFDGQDVMGMGPGARRSLGIEMIYQDLALAKQQDVASNIFLGREPIRRPLGLCQRIRRSRSPIALRPMQSSFALAP
jgi:simple sugar transport system ATP-binding protein